MLESQRILSQLNYQQMDYEYRQELASQANTKFLETIDTILKDYPILNEAYTNKEKEIESNIQKIIVQKYEEKVSQLLSEEDNRYEELQDGEDRLDSSETSEDRRTTQSKRLYREVVKMTHPDLVKSKKLNDLYIVATNYYNEKDFVELLLISYKLGIHIELENEDLDLVKDKIKFYSDRIKSLESTYSWTWFSTEDEVKKRDILLNFVKSRIV